jgi:hypothetical protein
MLFAFKRAAVAAQREGPVAQVFSLGIARVTGGDFSHVEAVLGRNPNGSYRCFSAREPEGTAFSDIDLTDTELWNIVNYPTAPSQDDLILAWCKGRQGRRYNFAGIAAIANGTRFTDSHDDFCSQCCVELAQDNLDLWPGLPPYWVAPSGWRGDPRRRGLFELLKGLQTWP